MDIDEHFATLTKIVDGMSEVEKGNYQAMNQPAIFGRAEAGFLISLN